VRHPRAHISPPAKPIRIEDVSSFGVIVKPIQIIFLIRDNINRLDAKYRLQGVNVGTLPDGILVSEPRQFRSLPTDFPTRVTEFQSALITTGVGQPSISLSYKDENGQTHIARAELDLGGIPNTPRIIKGLLTMDSTCGLNVRGAEKVISGGPLVR